MFGASLVSGPEWRIADDGATVEVENPVLRPRFAYAAAGVDGWFSGGESSGGGGRDGGIVEMYYKPTSPTRNLVFRNGQWGSLYDQMDSFEAEGVSDDRPFTVHTGVRHAEWGSGLVLGYDGDKMTVLFDEVGYKTLSVPVVRAQQLLVVD